MTTNNGETMEKSPAHPHNYQNTKVTLIGVALLSVCGIFCSPNGTNTAENRVIAQLTLSSQDRNKRVSFGPLVLDLDSDVVSQTTTIYLSEPATPPPLPPDRSTYTARNKNISGDTPQFSFVNLYDFGPDGTMFNSRVGIIFPSHSWQDDRIYVAATWDGSKWRILKVLMKGDNTYDIWTTHFCLFAITAIVIVGVTAEYFYASMKVGEAIGMALDEMMDTTEARIATQSPDSPIFDTLWCKHEQIQYLSALTGNILFGFKCVSPQSGYLVTDYFYSIDNKSFTNHTALTSVILDSHLYGAGAHWFFIKGRDSNGNESRIDSIAFNVLGQIEILVNSLSPKEGTVFMSNQSVTVSIDYDFHIQTFCDSVVTRQHAFYNLTPGWYHDTYSSTQTMPYYDHGCPELQPFLNVFAYTPYGVIDTSWSGPVYYINCLPPPDTTDTIRSDLPSTPILLSPSNGVSGVSTSPTFIWNSSIGATSYHIQVSTSIDLLSYVVNDSSITGVTMSATGFTDSMSYYWHVRAKNSYGTSSWSPTWSMSIGNNTGSITDIDGNVYHAVTIGTQIWMVENLKTTRYSDGTQIPFVTDNIAWQNLKTHGYCWYNNDPSNKAIYGAQYNWYTVNTGKLAPTGWHVASDAEWNTLTEYLGGWLVAGGKLKEAGTAHWRSPNSGATNEFGFSALPGGYRDFSGDFYHFNSIGAWWSSTAAGVGYSFSRQMDCNYSHINRYDPSNNIGFSVRCVRD
jgi:uncharacterized protein (TIGR02145 family)